MYSCYNYKGTQGTNENPLKVDESGKLEYFAVA